MRFYPLFDIQDWIDGKGNRALHNLDIYNELDNPFRDVYRNTDDINRILATSNITYRANNFVKLVEQITGLMSDIRIRWGKTFMRMFRCNMYNLA